MPLDSQEFAWTRSGSRARTLARAFGAAAEPSPEGDPLPDAPPPSPSPSPARHPQPEAIPGRPWADDDEGIDPLDTEDDEGFEDD